MGQHLTHVGKTKNVSDLGYVYYTDKYRAQNCNGCPQRGLCHNGLGNRVIDVNHRLEGYKQDVRELLMSEKGLYHRSMRPIEPEAVFGHIKQCRHFRRFMLRGLENVAVEFGLVAMAHNLRKLAKMLQNGSCIAHFDLLFSYINTKLSRYFQVCDFRLTA